MDLSTRWLLNSFTFHRILFSVAGEQSEPLMSLHSLRAPSEMQKELTVTLPCLQLQLDLNTYVHRCTIHVRTTFLDRLCQGKVK